MDEAIRAVLDSLRERGIACDMSGLRKHHSQGIMSDVYVLPSSDGELIVHVASLISTIEHFRPWEKLKPISDLLRSIPGIPAAEVLCVKKLPGCYIVVQKRLVGEPAGRIVLKDNEISMQWSVPIDTYGPKLEGIIARIHAVPIEGFGLLSSGEAVCGTDANMREFLQNESTVWMKGITDAERSLGNDPAHLETSMEEFLNRAMPRVDYDGAASLVSCDIVNPSNVLVHDQEITGVIDWEWAIAADPAWEFCYDIPHSMETYFDMTPSLVTKDSQMAFLHRSRLYKPFLFMMWTYGVSGDPTRAIYTACRERMLTNMQVFQ